MMDDDAADDGLAELRAAASVTDLHRLLVTHRLSGHSTRHREAVDLFVLHHRADQVGAVDSAVLLCTESRWNRCTAKLIVGICAADILDDDALDTLADRLLCCCAGPPDTCYAGTNDPRPPVGNSPNMTGAPSMPPGPPGAA